MAAVGATHRLYVKQLYKRYLTNALDWAVQRDVWRAQAIQIRAEFDRHKNEKDPKVIQQVINDAEAKLAALAHPDPYISAKFPGGTSWERSLPPPPNAFTKFVTNEHHHEDHHEVETVEEPDYLLAEQRERVGPSFRLSQQAIAALNELAASSRREKVFIDGLKATTEEGTKTRWDDFLVKMKEKGHDISALEVDPMGRKYSEYSDEEKIELITRWEDGISHGLDVQTAGIIEQEISDHQDRKDGVWR